MKSAIQPSQAKKTAAKASTNGASGDLPNMEEIFDKIENHQFFSPKYPKVIRDSAFQKTHSRLRQNPDMTLKEILIAQMQNQPDWMPPQFMLLIAEAVVKAWQAFHEKNETLVESEAVA